MTTIETTMSNQQTTYSDSDDDDSILDDYSMGRADDNPNLPAAVEFGDGRKLSEEFFYLPKGRSRREDHQ